MLSPQSPNTLDNIDESSLIPNSDGNLLENNQQSLHPQGAEIVFVDSNIENVAEIMANIDSNYDEIRQLSPDTDSLTQITETLSNYQGLNAIHFVTHGQDGVIQAGDLQLNEGNLSQYQDSLLFADNYGGDRFNDRDGSTSFDFSQATQDLTITISSRGLTANQGGQNGAHLAVGGGIKKGDRNDPETIEILDLDSTNGDIFNLTIEGGLIKGLPNSGSIDYTSYDEVRITLGSGNDTTDVILGGADKDYIFGGKGNNNINGEEGENVIFADEVEITFNSGEIDQISLTEDNNNSNQSNLQPSDNLRGGNQNDLIIGNEEWDYIYGNGGDDEIYGYGSQDNIFGGAGNDQIDGGLGNDVIRGESDDDYLYGDMGADRLYGDQGHDTLDGGSNNDYLYGNDGNDFLYGSDGIDYLYPGAGLDTLDGSLGGDYYYGDSDKLEDYFVIGLNQGSDRLFNFEDNIDKIFLVGGLTFADLSITVEATVHTKINSKVTGELLIIIYGHTPDKFTIEDFVSDVGSEGTSNTAPTLTGSISGQTISDEEIINPFSEITITDVDLPKQLLTVTISLDNSAKGILRTSNDLLIDLVDRGNGVYEFVGTADAINSSLDDLVFEPTPNRVAVGATETTTFTITVNDGYTTITDNLTSVITTSVNNTPKLINPIPEQTLQVNTAININLSNYFQDLDLNDTLTYSIDSLPTGLTLDSATGIITGQLSTPTNITVTVTVTVTGSLTLIANNLELGTNNTDYKYFNTDNNANNFYDGDGGNDYIYGYGGDDYLYGNEGGDRIYGGNDNDTVEGGAGNDYVYGDNGDDFVLGNQGSDYLYSGNGFDTLDGGAGNDNYYGNKDNLQNIYVIGEGNDKIYNFDEQDSQGNVVDKLQLTNGLTFLDLEIVDSGANVYIKHAGKTIVTIYTVDHLLFTTEDRFIS